MDARKLIYTDLKHREEIIWEKINWEKLKASSEEKERFVKEVLILYNHVFSLDEQELGWMHLAEFKIPTMPGELVQLPPRRLSPFNRGQVREEVAKLEEMGLVTKSLSPWSSPIVVVQRPGETKIWLCINFREMNKCIVDDHYPLLRVDDLIDGAGDGPVTHFSMLDLAKGFHQIPIEKNSQEKTAFVCLDGFMHWLYMPFGLKTCPSFSNG